MPQGHDKPIISVVHTICCGLDVHKASNSDCLLVTAQDGGEDMEIAKFDTFTDALIRWIDWLIERDCPVMVMESTGVNWRPVHNVLEGYVKVVLVNARHKKHVPGRKTDLADSQWLVGLLRHGLLRGSLIPPQQVRQWREMTRLRKAHQDSLADFKWLIHKLLECAYNKLGVVVSDLFGATGRYAMDLLATREAELSADDIAAGAHGQLKQKITEFCRALEGFFIDHHRYQLRLLLATVTELEHLIEQISQAPKNWPTTIPCFPGYKRSPASVKWPR